MTVNTINHMTSSTLSHIRHTGLLTSTEHWSQKTNRPIIIYTYTIYKTNLVVSGMSYLTKTLLFSEQMPQDVHRKISIS